MDRERAPNRWQDWRFTIAEVVADEDGVRQPSRRVLRDDGKRAAHALSRLHARAARRPGRRLLPQPQLGRAGVVRRLAHRRRRPVARLAGNGQRLVHRSRPLARRAGARRQRAAAGRPRRLAAGLHRRSTTGRKRRRRGAGRSRSWRRRSASDGGGDGFLSRWSRRKAEARSGAPTPEAAPAPSARRRTGDAAAAAVARPRPTADRARPPTAPAGADPRRCRRSTTSPG